MSTTYHKRKKKRTRVHGFRKRMKTVGGRRVIVKRRRKKRQKLSV